MPLVSKYFTAEICGFDKEASALGRAWELGLIASAQEVVRGKIEFDEEQQADDAFGTGFLDVRMCRVSHDEGCLGGIPSESSEGFCGTILKLGRRAAL